MFLWSAEAEGMCPQRQNQPGRVQAGRSMRDRLKRLGGPHPLSRGSLRGLGATCEP